MLKYEFDHFDISKLSLQPLLQVYRMA